MEAITEKDNIPKLKPKRQPKPLKLFGALALFFSAFLLCAAGLVYYLYAFGGYGTFRLLGAVGLLLIFFAAFGCYLFIIHREVTKSLRKMLFICLLLVIAAALVLVCVNINAGFSPVLIAVLLIALMIGPGVAVFSALPLAVMSGVAVGVLNGPAVGSWAISFSVLVFSLTAVFALKLRRTRTTVVLASFIAGCFAVASYAFTALSAGLPFTYYWQSLLWLMGSCLLCGVLTVGLMPVFESLFDIASEERLNELLNNDNPLLKRLVNEAPGTYHHSILVASLAESAAEAVGANALLARVAAYYHDVGKLRCPLCFKENQKTGHNMHDELDPYESAKRIIAHQQDGVILLQKHKFPREVVEIVGEHHGDSVMVYFYDKAVKQAGEGVAVDESLFRYPSHKPTTKESAILMMADCCEAAVRSMVNPTMEDIRNKIIEVISHKWNKRDSMLWASPLTFAEIKKVEDCFLQTFTALYHERVEYPDLEEIDVR